MATMKTKSVGFNIDCQEERKQFEYACMKSNFSRYVKDLIGRDMQKLKGVNGIKINLTDGGAQ